MKGFMRRRFMNGEGLRRARLVWSILAAFGLLIALAGPADAEDGAWDPTLPPTISAGAP
ncbi:MAG: peptidoglycan DL-endopeptidase RipB, partial [Mycobacterium sp.]|nr:peptidoglycan DL-endopeptidase RipB [Mycobacterium sp.]